MTIGKFGLDVLADMLNCRMAACMVSLLSTVGMGGECMFLFCGLVGSLLDAYAHGQLSTE